MSASSTTAVELDATDFDTNASRIVKMLMAGRNLEAQNLAPAVGMSKSTLYNRLSGKPWLANELDRIATHFSVTADIGKIRIPSGAPRDLQYEEVVALLAVCPDDRATLMVLLMVHLALRAGDLARVRVEDIDLRRRRLHVRGKGGRGEPTSWVPIPSEAWRYLDAWLVDGGRPSGPLIRSYQRPTRGLRPSTVGKLVGQWMRAAELKRFPYDGRSSHSLRHSCAQHMIDRGAEPREVQYTLGHKSLRTTEESYLNHEPAGLRAAMEGRSYVADARAAGAA